MNYPHHKSCIQFLLFAGIFIGLAGGQVVRAASEEIITRQLTGQEVYSNVCIACHYPPGIGGAPALGDREAWTPRIAQGIDTLNEHALNGFTGDTGVMPKKGERLDMSDEEIIRAVKYMVEQVAGLIER